MKVTEKQFHKAIAELYNMMQHIYNPMSNADYDLCEFTGLLYQIGSNPESYKQYFRFSQEEQQ